MRILVTRPQPDADRTAARLASLGHDPVVAPVLSTVLLPPPRDLPDPAAIAVTSRNGVRSVATWPRSADWHAIPVFAVGAATAAAAHGTGFRTVRTAHGDAAALAELILATFDRTAGPLLYAAAEDRTPVLEERLRAAGIDVVTAIAYRMVPLPAFDEAVGAIVAGGRLDGILLYSERTAAAFLAIVRAAGLEPALARLKVYALSAHVAAVLDGIATAGVSIAPEPESDSLLALIGSPEPANRV